MKNDLYLIFVAALFVTSCAKEEFVDESEKTVAPEIIASQENQSGTKTILNVNEGVGTIYWKPAENINVFYGTTNVQYTSKNKENVTVASFKTTEIIGATEEASTNIWGLYPYNEDAVCNGSKVTTTIASTQYGVPETFDDNLFTTLAHSETRELRFYNVCGGIKFSLSRADITKITFEGNNGESLAGKVDLSFVDDVPAATSVTAATKIILTPKTGSTFAKDVNYYIVTLPVSMPGGFTMTFETATQIGTFNYTAKAVTVSRSKFSKKEDIDTYATFVSKTATDLSSSGTANCYIVPAAGTYKFKAVKGNSITSVGDVKGVKVLWETFGTDVTPSVGDLIYPGVSYNDNYITFSTNNNYKEGNAVIAAYCDANCTDGNVLWSWHIWLTDQPEEQVYNNNAGTMMDRNLGATSATPGDVHALGLLYQWGRKDPFLSGKSTQSNNLPAESTLSWPTPVETNAQNGTIEYAISHPTTYIKHKSPIYDWLFNSDASLWNSNYILYDPCPNGWRVPWGGDSGIWAIALGNNAYVLNKSTSSRGVNFGKSSLTSYYQLGIADTIWYPWSGYINDNLLWIGYTGLYWSRQPSTEDSYCFEIDYGSSSPAKSERHRYYANSVRCQKIENK